MMKLTKTGIGLLTRQYRSVLRKCWMINVGLFALGAMMANEANASALYTVTLTTPGGTPSVLYPAESYTSRTFKVTVSASNQNEAIKEAKKLFSGAWRYDSNAGHYYNDYITSGINYISVGGNLEQEYSMANEFNDMVMNSTNWATTTVVTDFSTFLTSSAAANTYQTKLTTEQLNAANSGITSTKVNTYDGYADTIATKATLDEVREINDLNNYYTKFGLGGKNEGKNAGNVPCHLEGLSTSERPVKIYAAKMRSENILSSLFVPMRSLRPQGAQDDGHGFAFAVANDNADVLLTQAA